MMYSGGLKRFVIAIGKVKPQEINSAIRIFSTTIAWLSLLIFLIYVLWTGALWRAIDAIKVSHVEAFGVKLDFNERQNELIATLVSKSHADFFGNSQLIMRAVSRSELNAGAVRGKRILWVDDHPDNNSAVIDLLSDMGIVVIAVTSDDAMMKLLDSGMAVDIIVTDGTRDQDRQGERGPALKKCPVTFIGRTSYLQPTQTLQEYNREVSAGIGIPSGFRTVEAVARWEENLTGQVVQPSWSFTDISGPRIIMFSGTAGGNSVSPCIRTITNRYEVLLNAILNILEESSDPVLPAKADHKSE